MKTAFTIALIAGLCAPPLAQASFDLARKSGCMSCHMIEPGKKGLGPNYPDVAAKYAGKEAAPKLLAEKIRKGGKGAWGEIPMPPHPNLKDAEIDALVKWILSGAGK